ncbi:proline and serine-rich protein 2 [Mastomys coucha]|uniref:proline and serine-rich protein 2 n=1 Tax=Mastomys coucha TaxID=35658 RepID=UPI001261B08F|nr:proline and serine-rich protein 2 [Mastomys coucha]XP_031215034.1 proline and serine-rich protein 2 [Mastomys coucha]XP_031215035.1 proline and serine-rich protein 2 [Mastomys coucha]XP_031215036.1 proline and serine-rich protein 2 [Mastomys coucha]XP_031215037.1 proline and serine-rich protein 2 [Mastomys coucha]XP_031215038.1 proline and serine-rich protein 2 [Mastomys coucha]
MPGNQQKPESLEMDSDTSPSGLSDLSRGGSLESRCSSSRSRSFTMDDESLKHLTHEEKDVILFFEETLDSLEYDFDEPALCDSGIHCHSPQSLEESPSSHSEPEDVIDLVQPAPAPGKAKSLPDVPQVAEAPSVAKQDSPFLEGRKQAAENFLPPPDSRGPEVFPLPPSLSVPAPSAPRKELMSPSPPAEHPKLLRSVPTPLVIAQKISEKLAGNEALSPTSPSKEARLAEWRTPTSLVSRNGDHVGVWHRHTAQPAPKIHRFPSNISVTNSAGKDFNKTISKAAVNVQERKAQVLANINGMSFIAAGDTSSEERWQKSEEQRSGSADGARTLGRAGLAGEPGTLCAGAPARAQQSQAVQTEQPPALTNGFQSVHEALRSEPSSFVPTSKTITFRPDPAVTGKLARQSASRSLYEPRPDGSQDARKRTGSLPRAVGFRPQGITVQFSGRGSTEEARREALRKLGLLKENL